MKFEIINKSELTVIGMRTNLTGSHSNNFKIISTHWKKFNQELYRVRNRNSQWENWKKFGVTFKTDISYSYLAAIEFHDKMKFPITMEDYVIESCEFVKFTHYGHLKNISKTVNETFNFIKLAPELNHKTNCCGVMMIEEYDNRFHWSSEKSEIDILFPIERLK